MPSFIRLGDLALHVDELLARPGDMAATRALVESYLASSVDDADVIPFPADPDEVDGGPLPNYDLPAPAPEQVAAALAALHDVHCHGAEKIIDLPAELPDVAAEDAERALRRALRWRATLERVRVLRGDAEMLAWFAVQLRRFELGLPQSSTKELPENISNNVNTEKLPQTVELVQNVVSNANHIVAETLPAPPPARHSIDFRSVSWYGAAYTFTKAQAAVVSVLWQSWQDGTPDVGHRTLLSLAKVDSDDLHDLFKTKGKAHPAWGVMIRSNVGSRGTARLCPPDAPPAEAAHEKPAKTPPCTPGGESRAVAQ